MRIGYGEDIHRLVNNRNLVLCGIKIPFEMGLEAHSDGDVVLHALSDAILGALGRRDIGYYFSDKDPKYKDIDSSLIIKEVLKMMDSDGCKIGNVDISICCEKPHLSAYIPNMINRLAELLGIKNNRISIKAMTNEKLDSIGEGKAIKAIAVVLLEETVNG